MAEAESLNFEQLTDRNWGTWKKRMKVFLRARDLWGLVDGSLSEPAGASADANAAGIAEADRLRKDCQKRRDKTVDYLYRTISSDVFYLVARLQYDRQRRTRKGKDRKCHTCKQIGHLARNCPSDTGRFKEANDFHSARICNGDKIEKEENDDSDGSGVEAF